MYDDLHTSCLRTSGSGACGLLLRFEQRADAAPDWLPHVSRIAVEQRARRTAAQHVRTRTFDRGREMTIDLNGSFASFTALIGRDENLFAESKFG